MIDLVFSGRNWRETPGFFFLFGGRIIRLSKNIFRSE